MTQPATQPVAYLVTSSQKKWLSNTWTDEAAICPATEAEHPPRWVEGVTLWVVAGFGSDSSSKPLGLSPMFMPNL